MSGSCHNGSMGPRPTISFTVDATRYRVSSLSPLPLFSRRLFSASRSISSDTCFRAVKSNRIFPLVMISARGPARIRSCTSSTSFASLVSKAMKRLGSLLISSSAVIDPTLV